LNYKKYKGNSNWFKRLEDIGETKPIRASIQGLESNLVDTIVEVNQLHLEKHTACWEIELSSEVYKDVPSPLKEVAGQIEFDDNSDGTKMLMWTTSENRLYDLSDIGEYTMFEAETDSGIILRVLFTKPNNMLLPINKLSLNEHVLNRKERNMVNYLVHHRLAGKLWRATIVTNTTSQTTELAYNNLSLNTVFGKSISLGNTYGMISYNADGKYKVYVDDGSATIRIIQPFHTVILIKFLPLKL